MISQTRLKYYSSLLQKKFREEENKFIAEGVKIVNEGLNSSYKCEIIFVRKDIEAREPELIRELGSRNSEIEILNEKDFNKISDSKTPQGVTAVFLNKPAAEKLIFNAAVCLDNISDPGNMGTIIRTCDWFGIKNIIAANNCADIYSPKVIRSSMGSVFHISFLIPADLSEELLSLKKKNFRIVTADMDGINLNKYTFTEKSIFVFSNEAHGVSAEVKKISDEIITIPGSGKAESLNVASASAVILSRFAEKYL